MRNDFSKRIPMNIALMLSGGVGTRLQSEIPKQYLCVGKNMIITQSLQTLVAHQEIDAIFIVAHEEWREQIITDLKQAGEKTDKIKGFVMPGRTRQFSIWNGLEEIKRQYDTRVNGVLIHDAARPNLSFKMITECMAELKEHEGVMPVLPMKDTVYLSENGNAVSKLLDRSKLFAGQAPEAFRFLAYYEANKRLLPDKLYEINGSTEPAVMAGMDVVMIDGDENNYKITTEADLKRFIRRIT